MFGAGLRGVIRVSTGGMSGAFKVGRRIDVFHLALIAAFGLVACHTAGTPKIHSFQEAASIHLAPISISPWTVDSISMMQPQFPMSATTALALALPKTSISQNSYADSFSAGLQIGLPQSTQTSSLAQALNSGTSAANGAQSSAGSTHSASSGNSTGDGTTGNTSASANATQASTTTTSTTNTSGGQSTTQTTTTQRGPGSLPANLLPAATLPNAAATVVPSGTVVADPLLAYTAATAIYQEIQMLNSYIEDAALRYGYVPYLARVQVSVQPFARNEPYDAYVDLGVFSRCRHILGGQSPVMVVPLFVTDDLESGQASDAMNIARQLALSLGGATGNVALQAGASNLSSKLNAILGTDFNSLYSVSRAGDNVVQVRLGATRSPNLKSGYSMLTQSHYVTMLILVDAQYAANDSATCFDKAPPDPGGEPAVDRAKRGPELWITSLARLRDAVSGKELPIDLSLRDKRAIAVMSRYVDEATANNASFPAIATKNARILMSDIAINNFEKFSVDYCNFADCEGPGGVPWGYLNALWTGLTTVMDMSEYAGIIMDIPKPSAPVVDTKQTVFLSDSCMDSASATINLTGPFAATEFSAYLTISLTDPKNRDPNAVASPAELRVAATGVTQPASGGPVVLQFPSLKPLAKTVPVLNTACADAPAAQTSKGDNAKKAAAAEQASARAAAAAKVEAAKVASAMDDATRSKAKQLATQAEEAAKQAAAKAASAETEAGKAAAAAANARASVAQASASGGLKQILQGATLTLTKKPSSIQTRWNGTDSFSPVTYETVFYSDGVQPSTTVKMTAASDSLSVDQTGSSQIRLFVAGGKNLTDIEIQLEGASLAPASAATPNPPNVTFAEKTAPYATLIVAVQAASSPPAVLDLYLRGITPSRAVTITGIGRLNGKAVAGAQAVLVLPAIANTPAKSTSTAPSP